MKLRKLKTFPSLLSLNSTISLIYFKSTISFPRVSIMSFTTVSSYFFEGKYDNFTLIGLVPILPSVV